MSFSITTTPLPHQELAVAKMLPSRVGGLLMEMGTGKSLALLMLAKARSGKWDTLFWFTPCALRENVRRQIVEHTDIDSICVWDSSVIGNVPDATIHVVGLETIGSSDRAVLEFDRLVTDKSFVVVDESHFIKNPKSRRGSRMIALSARARYRAILTGTPVTQGIADLYGQMTFLSPAILGCRSWWSFARNHLTFEQKTDANGRKYDTGRITSTHNEAYLAERMAPYVYQVKKSECLSLPEKLYQSQWCGMTSEQKAAYEAAKMEVLELDYDDWSPIAIFHLFTSLQTIVCGFWKRTNGEVVALKNNRLDLLLAVVGQTAGRVVIWAKYRRSVDSIYELLSANYGADSAHRYYGGQSSDERENDLQAWRLSGRFLVATQSMGGAGLTLVESATAVFFASSFKYSERLQAEDRQHRIGQTEQPLYISLGCTGSIDERIERSLSSKASIAGEFSRQIDLCKSKGMKDKALAMVRAL